MSLINRQFDFAVFEGKTLVATGNNDAIGNIVFSDIVYTRAGTHTYTIKESTACGDGWITDSSEYTAVVKITKENNELSASVEYQDNVIPTFNNQYMPGTATLKISKSLVDGGGNAVVAENETFGVILYEKSGSDWKRLGRYAIAANGGVATIPNLQPGATYQLVEEAGSWYKTLGLTIAVNGVVTGSSDNAAIAITIPALAEEITIEVVVSNEQIGPPSGKPSGGDARQNPPLIEIEETATSLSPFIKEHVAYVIGYPGGNVGPEREITHAEAAAIFFRLLPDDIRSIYWTSQNPFADVNAESWYNNDISVMSNMGIVKGYPNGTFNPNGAITRAEFATISARFARAMDMTPVNDIDFSDTGGHWAQDDIRYAAAIGWINGYPDGTFMPDQHITRAEVMTLVNRMLDRAPETVEDILSNDMVKWLDNSDENAWYYLAVQEATNSHLTECKDEFGAELHFDHECWVKMLENRDWAQLEKPQSTE